MIVIIWVNEHLKSELPPYNDIVIGALTAKTHSLRNKFSANDTINCNYFKAIRKEYRLMYFELLKQNKYLLCLSENFLVDILELELFYKELESVFAKVLHTEAIRITYICKRLINEDIIKKISKIEEEVE